MPLSFLAPSVCVPFPEPFAVGRSRLGKSQSLSAGFALVAAAYFHCCCSWWFVVIVVVVIVVVFFTGHSTFGRLALPMES